MTVIQNTAGNIIIENFYPILNVMAEVEELKCYQEEVPINGIKRFFEIQENGNTFFALVYLHNVSSRKLALHFHRCSGL